MKNNLSMGSFMRVNRINLLMCLVIVAVNVVISGVAFVSTEDIKTTVLDAVLNISIMFLPLYVFMCVLMNAIISVPKGVMLSTPRKKLYKTMVINDIINIFGAMVLVCILNFLVYGKLQLDGVSTNIISNLKLVGFAIILGLLISNLVEYICFMFIAFNVYYGLSNIFILLGIIFYFARDIFLMVGSGNVTLLVILAMLILILLLYLNYILLNKLEVRG